MIGQEIKMFINQQRRFELKGSMQILVDPYMKKDGALIMDRSDPNFPVNVAPNFQQVIIVNMINFEETLKKVILTLTKITNKKWNWRALQGNLTDPILIKYREEQVRKSNQGVSSSKIISAVDKL
jgi:hypothetical protein